MAKMDDLLIALKDYIEEKDTEFGFLISGDWGCGKTFFWKYNAIKLIDTLRIDNSKVKSIYISLFGLDSLSDLFDKIALQLYIPSGERYHDLLSVTGKTFLRWLKVDNIENALTKMINFKNVVLCFDDLERTDIQLKSLLGFINLLAEHYNVKTVIICSEKELLKDKAKASEYLKYKEKIIGVTYEFIQNYQLIIDKIIDGYIHNEKFHSFINNNADIIYNIFKRSDSNNIRVLKYSLSILHKIFDKLININPSILDEHGPELLIFLLVISFEIKTKNPDPEKLKNIRNCAIDESLLYTALSNYGDQEHKTFAKELIDRYYFDMQDLIFTSPAIFNYVMKGFLDLDEFNSEFKKDATPVDPKVELFKILISKYWELSDSEFDETVRKVLEFIKMGEIDHLYWYVKLFTCYIDFVNRNLINIQIDVVKGYFIEGMKKAYENGYIKYGQVSDEVLLGSGPEIKTDPNFNEVYEYSIQMQSNLENDLEEGICIETMRLITSDINKFISKITSSDNSQLLFKPFFKYVKADELLNIIINLSNKDIIAFRNALEYRYKIGNAEDRNHQEYGTLFELMEKLKTYLNDKDNKLSFALLKVLLVTLEKICKMTSGAVPPVASPVETPQPPGPAQAPENEGKGGIR